GWRRRRVHGPASKLLWEDVLSGKIGGRALENVVFHLQLLVAAAQFGELLLLGAGQPVAGTAVVVGVGLSQPVLQARSADAEVFGERSRPRCGVKVNERRLPC